MNIDQLIKQIPDEPTCRRFLEKSFGQKAVVTRIADEITNLGLHRLTGLFFGVMRMK